MKKNMIYRLILVSAVLSGLFGCSKNGSELIWQSDYMTGQQGAETQANANNSTQPNVDAQNGAQANANNGAQPNADSQNGAQANANNGTQANAVTEAQKIVVDVSGAVACPGVYELENGARVCDAIALAGGLTADADRNSLNQAQKLEDAQKIRVCTVEEAAELPAVSTQPEDVKSGESVDEKININRADVQQLTTLSGIGESRARDIIAYREANGGFQSVEDIMKVSGIKEATFNKIKDDIAVE